MFHQNKDKNFQYTLEICEEKSLLGYTYGGMLYLVQCTPYRNYKKYRPKDQMDYMLHNQSHILMKKGIISILIYSWNVFTSAAKRRL